MGELPKDKLLTIRKILTEAQKGKDTKERIEIFVKEFSDQYDNLGPDAIAWMRHSVLVAEEVFGLEIDHFLDSSPQGAWDSTTPVLTAAMLHYIKPEHTVISLGPGPFATEACVVSKEKDMQIITLEIWEPYIESGKKTSEANNANVIFIKSDVYTPIDPVQTRCLPKADNASVQDKNKLPENVDYITWNPPYVPSADAKKSGFFDSPKVVSYAFDGGPEGTTLIERGLRELPENWKTNAKLLFGVNTVKVSEDSMRRIAEKNGFNLLEIFKLSGSPCEVFVFQHTSAITGDK
ncbi:hypothetical protein ACFL2G_00195 [Candidatus Omnitrophota bacterium]